MNPQQPTGLIPTSTESIYALQISTGLLTLAPQSGGLEKYSVKDPFKYDEEFADDTISLDAIYSGYEHFFDGEYHLVDRETVKLINYDDTHLNLFGAKQFGFYLLDNYPLPT